jgi:N-ethylmaleimide reductase
MHPSPLFQPYTLGRLKLPNRIVMASLTRSRSDERGLLPASAREYYRQRASAGLIISEATNISAQARGASATPGIWTDAQVECWAQVNRAVHAEGGRIFVQLWHTGRLSHRDLQPDGASPVAPSAIAPQGQAFTASGLQEYGTPRALAAEEVDAIVADYEHAARRAKEAGFDGVEIHSANNYLLAQFLSDFSNHRDDHFGGSLENRLRFPLAVAEAVTRVWNGDRVGVRRAKMVGQEWTATSCRHIRPT